MTINVNKRIVPNTFLQGTYKHDKCTSDATKFLQENQTLPLNWKNPQLVSLTQLGLYSYFSGTLHNCEKSYAMRITVRPGLELPTIKWESELKLKGHMIDNHYSLQENSGIYARLLTAMGFQTICPQENGEVCTKASVGSQLPRYICDAVRSTHLNEKRPVVCNEITKNLVDIWLQTKATLHKKVGMRVYLMTQPTINLVNKQAQTLYKAWTCAYPQIHLPPEQIRIYPANSNSSDERFSGCFYFPKYILEKLCNEQSAPKFIQDNACKSIK